MVACVAPVIILGIPIFDTLLVMYIRWQRGIPVIFGSPDHFALRLRKWRLSTRQTVIISYAACLFLGILAIIMLLTSAVIAIGLVSFIVLAGIWIALFLKRIDMTL